jgi:hypothetical protein
MKTSKIIFISLLSLGALYIVAAMLSVRFSGQKGELFNDDSKGNIITIPAFNVLCITDSKDLNIHGSDSAYFKIINTEDSIPSKIDYVVRGDTLFITGLQNQPATNRYVVLYISNDMKSIQLKNSNIFLMEQSFISLSITLDNSRLSSGIKNNILAFGTLKISAMNNSSISMNSLKADSIEVYLRNSKAFLTGSSKKLNGVLWNNSRLSSSQNGELSLKKDASSKIILY